MVSIRWPSSPAWDSGGSFNVDSPDVVGGLRRSAVASEPNVGNTLEKDLSRSWVPLSDQEIGNRSERFWSGEPGEGWNFWQQVSSILRRTFGFPWPVDRQMLSKRSRDAQGALTCENLALRATWLADPLPIHISVSQFFQTPYLTIDHPSQEKWFTRIAYGRGFKELTLVDSCWWLNSCEVPLGCMKPCLYATTE